ncbi:unnamed protein product, partial [Iphiclides podalirius]
MTKSFIVFHRYPQVDLKEFTVDNKRYSSRRFVATEKERPTQHPSSLKLQKPSALSILMAPSNDTLSRQTTAKKKRTNKRNKKAQLS